MFKFIPSIVITQRTVEKSPTSVGEIHIAYFSKYNNWRELYNYSVIQSKQNAEGTEHAHYLPDARKMLGFFLRESTITNFFTILATVVIITITVRMHMQ